MTFITREAALKAYDKFIRTYYSADIDKPTCKIVEVKRGFDVMIYGPNGHFLTYL